MKDALSGNATPICCAALANATLSLLIPYDTEPLVVVSTSAQNGAITASLIGNCLGKTFVIGVSTETSPFVAICKQKYIISKWV